MCCIFQTKLCVEFDCHNFYICRKSIDFSTTGKCIAHWAYEYIYGFVHSTRHPWQGDELMTDGVYLSCHSRQLSKNKLLRAIISPGRNACVAFKLDQLALKIKPWLVRELGLINITKYIVGFSIILHTKMLKNRIYVVRLETAIRLILYIWSTTTDNNTS